MQDEEIPTPTRIDEAEILAEFERLVLEGHSREKAERLTSKLFGRVALGAGGRTRAAIIEVVRESKVKKPKKPKAETETKEVKAETITELATEAFNAEGIWEPKETNEVERDSLDLCRIPAKGAAIGALRRSRWQRESGYLRRSYG